MNPMIVNNKVLMLFFWLVFSSQTYAQKKKFPKDDLYILFDKKDSLNKKIINYSYKGKNVIVFGINKYPNGMGLLFRDNRNSDTISKLKLSNYKTIKTKREADKLEQDWINRKFKGFKYKPPANNKNAVFNTYLIEIISEEEMVIYPVEWSNGGHNVEF